MVFVGLCHEGLGLLGQQFLDNTALYRILRPIIVRLNHADIDLYVRIIAEAAKIAREKYGVETLVPYVRSWAAYLAGTGYDDDAIIRGLQARGVSVLDVTLKDDPAKKPVYAIAGDGHPTLAANIIRAHQIAEALKGVKLPGADLAIQAGCAAPAHVAAPIPAILSRSCCTAAGDREAEGV